MRRSAASHGASSNVLVHVHDAGWVHVVLRHIVHQAQSAKNCMACCLMLCCKVLYHSFRGAFHDELGQDGACHGHGRRKHLAVHGLSFLFSCSHRRSVRDHPVVPSKQVAQQCLERGHPVAQGLCVLLVRGWLPDASLLQGWPPIRLQLGCRIVPSKPKVKFPSMSHACLRSLARALCCRGVRCWVDRAVTSVGVPHLHLHLHLQRVRTSFQPPRSTTERGWRVVGTSTRAVACAFASEPQPSPTLQKHRSRTGVPK